MAHDVRNPHIFVDGPGNTASGDQVMDNFDALWTARDAIAKPGRVVAGGKSIIATQESRSSTSYGLLTTPDRVQGLVVPQDGIIDIRYQARWTETNSGTARAAIFIGSNQLKSAANVNTGPVAQECGIGGTAGFSVPLVSSAAGLASGNSASPGYAGDVTTGQVIGVGSQTSGAWGVTSLFVSTAGTYDVSIQFKSTDGSAVQVLQRKLWVNVRDFS